MTDGVSIPTRLRRIIGQFPPISPDDATVPTQFEQLKDSIGQHDEFESVVVCEGPWPTERITMQHRVFGPLPTVHRWYERIGLDGLRLRPDLLSIIGHRRNRVLVELNSIIAPYSRK